MDKDNVDEQNDPQQDQRSENEDFVPGPLDEPSEADDSTEPIEGDDEDADMQNEDTEDEDIQNGID